MEMAKRKMKKERKKVVGREAIVGYSPVWGDIDRCIFGPGALVDSH